MTTAAARRDGGRRTGTAAHGRDLLEGEGHKAPALNGSMLHLATLLGLAPDTQLELVELRRGDDGSALITVRIPAGRLRSVQVPSARLGPSAATAHQAISVTYGLEHDEARQRFILCGRVLRLVPQQYKLLRFLAGHPNQLLSPGQLLAGAWDDSAPTDRNMLQAAVSRLRGRLDSIGIRLIQTRRGEGYCFVPEPLRNC